MADAVPLQDRLHPEAPIRHCYGCGADNANGLKIKSYLDGDEGVCTWRPADHHCSYPGYLNGGVACTLIDCHSAWTVFAIECREMGLDLGRASDLPTGLTRALNIEFLKPTPVDTDLVLRAQVIKRGRASRTVKCSIYANGNECVRGEVVIVIGGL